jgi:hypothetical protein
MDLPAKHPIRLPKPSPAELCRRAQEAVVVSKVTIAQTRRLLDECWQEWHRCCWAHEERPRWDPRTLEPIQATAQKLSKAEVRYGRRPGCFI